MKQRLRPILWLLLREYLEHRRLWALAIGLGLAIIALDLALSLGGQAPAGGLHVMYHSTRALESVSGNRTGTHMIGSLAALGGYDLLLNTIAVLFALTLAVALFSYGLACLYDERRDRSLLFWKSLPISDAQCVAAKAITGLAVLPLVYAVTGLTTVWAAWAINIGLPMTAGPTPPMTAARLVGFSALVLGVLPVYAISLTPGLGWLMLCSAAVRRHPAIIALGMPLLCALLNVFGLPNPIWHWVAAPLVPAGVGHALQSIEAGQAPATALAWVYQPMSQPDPWGGVILGLAFLASATYCRRRHAVLA